MDGRSAAAPAAPPNCRSNSLRSMRIALFPSFMQRLSRHEGFWICRPADRKSLDPGNSARMSSPGYNIGGSRSKHDLKTADGRDWCTFLDQNANRPKITLSVLVPVLKVAL